MYIPNLLQLTLKPKLFFKSYKQHYRTEWIIGSLSIFIIFAYVFLLGRFEENSGFFRKDTITIVTTTVSLLIISLVYPHLCAFLTGMALYQQHNARSTYQYTGVPNSFSDPAAPDITVQNYEPLSHKQVFSVITYSCFIVVPYVLLLLLLEYAFNILYFLGIISLISGIHYLIIGYAGINSFGNYNRFRNFLGLLLGFHFTVWALMFLIFIIGSSYSAVR